MFPLNHAHASTSGSCKKASKVVFPLNNAHASTSGSCKEASKGHVTAWMNSRVGFHLDEQGPDAFLDKQHSTTAMCPYCWFALKGEHAAKVAVWGHHGTA